MKKAFTSEASLLSQLRAHGYQTIGFLHQVYPRGLDSPFNHTYFHKNIGKTGASSEQSSLFASLWAYAYLPEFFTRQMLPKHHLEQLESQTLLPDDAPFVSLRSFRRLMDWERDTTRKGGRYIFVHLIMPHVPNVLTAGCSYKRGQKTNIRDQSTCAARQVAEFLQFLRDERRFDEAMVVMHGDHGSRYIFEGGKLRRARDGHYGRDWSGARSRPLLLIKPSGTTEMPDLMVDRREADLFDVLPTILTNLRKPFQRPLVGSALLGKPARQRQRFYHFYDKDHAHIVDGTLKRYKIVGRDVVFDTEIAVPK